MNDTLQRVLAELPEIRQQARLAGKAFEFGKWVSRDYVTELKLCDALQAAADEIERLAAEVGSYIDEQFWREKEKQRLQAEINQLREALQVYADDSNWSSDWAWKGNNDPTLIAKRELGGNQG